MVLLLQRPDTLNQFRVVAGQQAREHVALLVFVVVGGGEVEIAQDVSGSLLRLCVGTLGGDMLEQPLEQVAAFLLRHSDAVRLPAYGHLLPVQAPHGSMLGQNVPQSPLGNSAQPDLSLQLPDHDGFYYALLAKNA